MHYAGLVVVIDYCWACSLAYMIIYILTFNEGIDRWREQRQLKTRGVPNGRGISAEPGRVQEGGDGIH
jgi:hypothetical protein